MKKIRIGNDFVFAWEIERNGLPEDLSSVLEKHLYLSVFGKRVELIEGVDYDITGNVIRIEVTPTIANILGTYKAEFHYILPDNGLIDDDRKCAVDVDAFQIVAKTAQADDSTEFSMTSDMAIAFKGDKGDSAYQVWLEEGNIGTKEDYFAYLQKPAVDAGASMSELEGEIQVNEDLRVQAESERDLAEATRIQSESERLAAEIIRQNNEGNRIENEATRVQNEAERISKENVRQSNETDRVEAEGVRVEAESERMQAEVERQVTIQEAVTATNLANEKANLANIAAQNANEAADSALTATQEATTAASLADTARLSIQDDLALKANHGYTSNPKTLKQVDDNLAQLESEVSLLRDDATVKMENLVVNGDFRNGLTGWTNLQSTLAVVDGKMVMTYLRSDGSLDKKKALNNSKHYIRIKYSNTDTPTNSARVLYFPSVTPHYFGTQISGDISAIMTPPLGTTSFKFLFYQPIGGKSTIERILLVDLEQTFGAGNEPTKEEMDLLISTLGTEYFEGEITIPAQKVMQWQLKMIRQNRSAIIALGGTIV